MDYYNKMASHPYEYHTSLPPSHARSLSLAKVHVSDKVLIANRQTILSILVVQVSAMQQDRASRKLVLSASCAPLSAAIGMKHEGQKVTIKTDSLPFRSHINESLSRYRREQFGDGTIISAAELLLWMR